MKGKRKREREREREREKGGSKGGYLSINHGRRSGTNINIIVLVVNCRGMHEASDLAFLFV